MVILSERIPIGGFFMGNKTCVFSTLKENREHMSRILPVKESFDLIQRDIEIGGKGCSFYFIDGFTKDEVMQKMMSGFFTLKEADMPSDAAEFSRKQLPYIEVDVINEFDQIVKNILSGSFSKLIVRRKNVYVSCRIQ